MDRLKLFLTNSLTRSKDEFTPLDPNHVKMYACGPTVYDRPHLGNARSAVVYDLLFRVLKARYKNVTYVCNITDVDDKIIKAARENNESISALTTRITKYYHEDMASINCLRPTREPKATEYISQMIEMINELIKKGNAYVAENHVLFSVSSFKDYGKLSNRSQEEMIAGARVEIAPFKKNPADFVLWKPAPANELDSAFDSPWGKGRPGWHIECSAMSKDCLGEEFDIHGGGADLMFPHHENEIAQSYCANGHGKFARYWVHNGFLTINGEKMSKSLGNFKTVREALDEGIEGVVIRYLYLTTHYRKPLDWSEKAVHDARKSIEKFRAAIGDVTTITPREVAEDYYNSEDAQLWHDELMSSLCDDLNTPAALAKLHVYAQRINTGKQENRWDLLKGCELLGLDLTEHKAQEINPAVIELAEQRKTAKLNKQWDRADELRKQIHALGYEVNDTADGYRLIKL